MTKEEFVTLQSELQQSGKTIKSYLQEKGVHYSTYHYWCNKFSGDTAVYSGRYGLTNSGDMGSL